MVPIVVPPAFTFDILAGGDNGRSAHHSHQIALTTNLDTQNTESALLTVESDSLDCSLQPFDGRIPVSRVLGATYHLLQSGSVFKAALFVLFSATTGTGIITPYFLACTKKHSMQAGAVTPAKSAQQLVV